VFEKLKSEGLATKGGLTKGRPKKLKYYVTYFNFAHVGAGLGYFPEHWIAWSNTPLWFNIWGDYTKKSREKLAELEFEEPSRLFIDEEGSLFIPLSLKVGVEENEVINDLVDQIKDIAELLNEDNKHRNF
jgi:hypothetical protein